MPAFQFWRIVAKLVNELNTASFYYLASFYALFGVSNVYIFLYYMLTEGMSNRRRRRGAQYRRVLEREKKAQSAVEYLLTYSWAILIVAYNFNRWIGQGTGSYSSNSPNTTITLNGPILETANYST